MKKILKISALISLFALNPQANHAQPGSWAEPYRICNNQGGASDIDMVVDDYGRIHVVWADNTRLGWWTFEYDILYVCKEGGIWSELVQISSMDTTYSRHPRIDVDSEGFPHVVWSHRYIFPDAEIFYSALTDSGWLEPTDVTPYNSSTYLPDICVDNNNIVNIVWADFLTGNYDIMHRRFDGEIWSDVVNVTNDDYNAGQPRIVVDSEENLHLTYTNSPYSAGPYREIYYSHYDGEQWLPQTNISNTGLDDSIDPDIAVDSNDNPHVVWKQKITTGVYDIFYNYSIDHYWQESVSITNLNCWTSKPDIQLRSDNTVFVLFNRDYDPNHYTNYMYYYDGFWTEPEPMYEEYPNWGAKLDIDSHDQLHACLSIDYGVMSDAGYSYYHEGNFVSNKNVSNEDESTYININPNPFNQSTNITLNIPYQASIQWAVYNINSQLVRQFDNLIVQAGEYTERWNGTDNFGKEAADGIYFLRLRVSDEMIIRKLVLLK